MTFADQPEDDESNDQSDLAFLGAVLGGPRGIELSRQFAFARDTVVQLRQYVPVLLDALERIEAEPASAVADGSLAARPLDEATRTRIREEVDAHFVTIEEQTESLPYDEAAIEALDESEVFADPFGVLGGLVDFGVMVRANLGLLGRVASLPHYEQAYWWEYARARERAPGLQVLLRSQYIVATSLIQPSIASLLLLVRRSQEDTSSTPADRATLDREVAQLLSRGPDAWRERLIERFGMQALDAAIDWHELGRTWVRRNLLVHRGGMVDALYKDAVPDAPPIGALLELSVDDVYGAFDFAGGVRIGFLIAAAELVAPSTGRRFAGAHGQVAIEDLDQGRWWLAEGTARAALAFAATDRDRAIARVNLWLARDGRLGLDAIRDDVAAWHTGNLPPTFQLAKLVLLRQDDAALDLIRRLLASDVLSRTELAIWPLFARLRSQRSLAEFES